MDNLCDLGMVDIEESIASLKLLGAPFELEVYAHRVVMASVKRGTIELIIPEIVTDIGGSCCCDNIEIQRVVFSNSLVVIGECAFEGCTGLKNITIPQKVARVDTDAFLNCSNIERFTVDKDNYHYSSDDSGALFNREQTVIIVAPDKIKAGYIIPNTVEIITESCFSGCDNLIDIEIPRNVQRIQEFAFLGCRNIIRCDIKADISILDVCVFASCINLEEVKLPAGLREINKSAFSGCTKLGELVVPDSLTVISERAFEDCDSIVLVCRKDSYTEKFAINNNIKYKII